MRYIIPIFLSLLLIGCPKPDEKLDPVTCDEGYHPCGPDSQECCLDTTSHEILWSIDTLGLPGSIINAVEIVSPNNIWVVGDIKMPDPDSSSNGTGIESFNAAIWDGVTWEIVKLFNGGAELSDIVYFSSDDIWILAGMPIHWDGSEWTIYHLWRMGILNENDGSVNKTWGTSSSNIWFAGSKGTIVHYNGNSFTKRNSGTNIRLNHIYGLSENTIFAVGDDSQMGESVILKYENGNWSTKVHYVYNQANQSQPAGPFRGVWLYGDTLYTLGGWGLWHESLSTGNGWLKPYPQSILPTGMPIELSGTSYSDIFDIGQCSTINHYNGSTWAQVIPYDCSQYLTLNGIDFYGDNYVSIVGGQYVFNGTR